MKKLYSYLATAIICVTLFSCKHQEDITKRKYTDGIYKDFSLHREKGKDSESEDSCRIENEKGKLVLMKEQVVPDFPELKVEGNIFDSHEALTDNYPIIAERVDSAIAHTMRKDSTWRTDSLPDCISSALSSQAMVGVGTTSGLITMAAPGFIWFAIIPMIGIPFFLLISLVSAGIAYGKITRGEIDASYKKWLRLWALCLVVNVILGSFLFMHFIS
jgi:major membrane immunogen (membrane-anchored lipoprotein)